MVFKKRYKMTEEHKKAIGLANSISLKGKHCSTKTEFRKGQKAWNKGIEMPEIQKENHPFWKGGRYISRKLAKEYGKDLTICQICKDKPNKTLIHHHNGNKYDNREQNLAVLCSFCHNAIHDTSNKIANRFQVGHLLNQHGIVS